jgi:REP-associated tyrosine transposase
VLVKHASEYPWSSYHCNADGRGIHLITAHNLYLALGKEKEERQKQYRQLLLGHMSALYMSVIRESTNRAWVLGSVRFKATIAEKTGEDWYWLEKAGIESQRSFVR